MLVFIEKIYQTLEIVFEYYSKHLEVRQKYSAARTFLLVFGNVAKQSLSWLIYYLSHTSLSKNSRNHNCEEGYSKVARISSKYTTQRIFNSLSLVLVILTKHCLICYIKRFLPEQFFPVNPDKQLH